MSDIKVCPITGHEMKLSFSEIVLRKYDVDYYSCEECGILQTEKPYWLDEAYQDAIGITDTGMVSRNISNQKILEPILERMFNSEGKFLDVGGGYGLLTRLMRDIGFDCYTFDRYCENMFAKYFEPIAGFKADALFCFEVFEHIEDPYVFIRDMFIRYCCKTIIFSTLVYENSIPSRDWWYYSFDGGQHITFYQSRTLSLLANRLGCHYYMINHGLHIITDVKLTKLDKYLFSNKYLFRIFALYTRYKRRRLSKTWDDHLLMKKEISKG